MVQKAAQREVDLDLTAAMLRDELSGAGKRDAAVQQLAAHLTWERDNERMAVTALRMLYVNLHQKNLDLEIARQELLVTKVSFEGCCC